MNVYLYQSWTEKILKNAYIGKVYEYSYDFRNKTSTQVTNDGWTAARWSINVNSTGLYYSSSLTEIRLNLSQLPTKLSNAKKITYYLLWKHGNSWTADLVYSTCYWAYPSASNITWLYNSYGSYNRKQYWGTETNFTLTPTAWDIEYTYTLDLENKTWLVQYIQWSTSSSSLTLTDAQITNIKTNDYIRIVINWSNEAVSKIELIIE